MVNLNGASVYVMSGQTQAMRNLATAAIHGAVCERYGRHLVDTYRRGRVVSVVVVIPRIWWLLLGLRHWWIARRVTRIARLVATRQQIDVLPKGHCR